MCLAIPFQLIRVEGKTGVGEASGVQRTIRLDFIREPKVGDYVICHAGFAIERLNEKQALENLQAISEAANAV